MLYPLILHPRLNLYAFSKKKKSEPICRHKEAGLVGKDSE